MRTHRVIIGEDLISWDLQFVSNVQISQQIKQLHIHYMAALYHWPLLTMEHGILSDNHEIFDFAKLQPPTSTSVHVIHATPMYTLLL